MPKGCIASNGWIGNTSFLDKWRVGETDYPWTYGSTYPNTSEMLICALQGTTEKSPYVSASAPYMMSTKRGSMYASSAIYQTPIERGKEQHLTCGCTRIQDRSEVSNAAGAAHRSVTVSQHPDPDAYLVLYDCPLMMMASMWTDQCCSNMGLGLPTRSAGVSWMDAYSSMTSPVQRVSTRRLHRNTVSNKPTYSKNTAACVAHTLIARHVDRELRWHARVVIEDLRSLSAQQPHGWHILGYSHSAMGCSR